MLTINWATPGAISITSNASPGSRATAAAAGTLKPIVAALKSPTFIGNVIG